MRTALVTALVVSFCTSLIVAQDPSEKAVLAAEAALAAAIAAGDHASYDRLTTDDFVWFTPSGTVMTKTERLELLKRGPAPGFAFSDARVRPLGDVAIVTGLHRPTNGRAMRYSRVWVRQGSQWRATLNHATFLSADAK